jgi:SnoaL-like domain
MLSLQELSDRVELEQLSSTYANAIDAGNWDGLDAVFTPDAYIDYRALGGIDGHFPAIKKWLSEVLPKFPGYCHLVGNIAVTVTGDTATGRTLCINPMNTPLPAGGSQVMWLGLWYNDKYARTPKGWRFTERVEQPCFAHNVPEHMAALTK